MHLCLKGGGTPISTFTDLVGGKVVGTYGGEVCKNSVLCHSGYPLGEGMHKLSDFVLIFGCKLRSFCNISTHTSLLEDYDCDTQA